MSPFFMPLMGHGGYGHGGRRSGWSGAGPWASGWSRNAPPFGGWNFPNFPFGNPRGRASRGDVRAAVLLLLSEQPRHGYEIITELVERSEGRWQPSPGSVYPVLKRLAADGLVRSETEGERRVFRLTEAGRRYVEDHADELGEPWAEIGGAPESTMELLDAARQAAGALWQVAQTGDPDQLASATAVLVETRKQLYRVLAGDAFDDESSDPFVREAMSEAAEDDPDGSDAADADLGDGDRGDGEGRG